MKRVLSILLCLTFLFALVGCGDNGGGIPEEYDEFAESAGSVSISSDPIAFNYLTGEYNMPEDRVGKRAFCISVDNADTTWPQSGISKADILIEMETEYGITRLMGIYDDTRDLELVGPVRSLRDQFLEMIYPLDPIVVHIGYSVVAGRKLAEHNLGTLDGDTVGKLVYIDQSRKDAGYALWQTKFTSGLNIEEAIDITMTETDRLGENTPYFNFVDEGSVYEPAGGGASRVTFLYSQNDAYDGDFRYDAASNQYLKFQRDKAHMDEHYNAQLAFDNVIVILADITPVDDTELINVDYQSGGKAYYFSQGKYEEVTWSKGDYSTTIEFTRADGSPLTVNTGKTMIALMRGENADTLEITP